MVTLTKVSTSQPLAPPSWDIIEDLDQDGMMDIDEILWGMDPLDPADGLSDLDWDTLSLAWEFDIGTDPAAADTDTDGWSDADELLLYDTDPLDELSFPLLDPSLSGAGPVMADPTTESTTLALTIPPDPSAPSIINGDFNDASISNWQNAQTFKDYQGGGFDWGAGSIGGWSAYAGSTVEVWAAGGEKFIELDGSPGNYGVKQPITHVIAGSYILAWKQTGRNNSKAETNPYVVRIYYKNGASEVKISESTVISGFDSFSWTDKAHGFKITPEQLTAAGSNPIYVAFIPTGSLNTYGTLIDKINLIPVEIEEIISDQIAGNEANKLPTPYYGGQPNNPMLMATHSGSDARLIIKMNVPASKAGSIRVGVREHGQKAILNSATSIAPPGKTPLSFSAFDGSKTYEIVAGYNLNGNTKLDPEEVTIVFQKTPKTNTPGSGGGVYTGAHWDLVDKFIVVTQDDFVSAQSATKSYGGFPYNVVLPNASKLIDAFATGAEIISGTNPTIFGNYLSANGIGTPAAFGLSLPLGAKWNNVNEASTHLFDFPDDSDFSRKIKDSNTIQLLISRLITSNKKEILEFTQNGFWITHILVDVEDRNVDFKEGGSLSDMALGLGKCRFRGNLEVEMIATPGGFNVRSVKISGFFIDLYDFSWPGGKLSWPGFSIDVGNATKTQAGYASLTAVPYLNSGRIFYTGVTISKAQYDFFEKF